MRIPVMDAKMHQLMPTTPTRAKLLLKNGQASPYWNTLGVFCIILKKKLNQVTNPLHWISILAVSSKDGQ